MDFAQGEEAESERALRGRLLAGDPTATADLASRYLEPLTTWLLRTFPGMDPDLLRDIATDLILSLGEHPGRFNPDRGPLLPYLKMSARGDVKNAWRGLGRRSRHEIVASDVDFSPGAGNTEGEAEDVGDLVAREDSRRAAFEAIRSLCTDEEWEVVRLMIDGERRTSVYARALGLSHLPDREQAREVKRVKDRLLKRLRRRANLERDDG